MSSSPCARKRGREAFETGSEELANPFSDNGAHMIIEDLLGLCESNEGGENVASLDAVFRLDPLTETAPSRPADSNNLNAYLNNLNFDRGVVGDVLGQDDNINPNRVPTVYTGVPFARRHTRSRVISHLLSTLDRSTRTS